MPKRSGSPSLSELYGQRHKLTSYDLLVEPESIIVLDDHDDAAAAAADDDDDIEIVYEGSSKEGSTEAEQASTTPSDSQSRNIAEEPNVQTEREEEVSSENAGGDMGNDDVSTVVIEPGQASSERRRDEGQKRNDTDIPSLDHPSWLTDSHNDEIFHINETNAGESGQGEPSETQESSSRCSRPVAPKRRVSRFHVDVNYCPSTRNDEEAARVGTGARQHHSNMHARSRSPVRVRNNSGNRNSSPVQPYSSTSSGAGRRNSHEYRGRERLRNEYEDHPNQFNHNHHHRDNRHQNEMNDGSRSRNRSEGSSPSSRDDPSHDPRLRGNSDHHHHRGRGSGIPRGRGGHPNDRRVPIPSGRFGSASHHPPSHNHYRSPTYNSNSSRQGWTHEFRQREPQHSQSHPISTAPVSNSNRIFNSQLPHCRQNVNNDVTRRETQDSRTPPTNPGRINSDTYRDYNVSSPRSPHYHRPQQQNTGQQEVNYGVNQHQPDQLRAPPVQAERINSEIHQSGQNISGCSPVLSSPNQPQQSTSRPEGNNVMNQPPSQPAIIIPAIIKRTLPTKRSAKDALKLILTCNEYCQMKGVVFPTRHDAIDHLAKEHDKEFCFVCFKTIRKTGPEHRNHVAEEHEDSGAKSLCPIDGCFSKYSYGGMYIHQVRAHYQQIEEGDKHAKKAYSGKASKFVAVKKIKKQVEILVNQNRPLRMSNPSKRLPTSTNREPTPSSSRTSSEGRVSSPLPSRSPPQSLNQNQAKRSSRETRSSNGSKTSAHPLQQLQIGNPGGSSIDEVEKNLANQPRSILGKFKIPKKKT